MTIARNAVNRIGNTLLTLGPALLIMLALITFTLLTLGKNPQGILQVFKDTLESTDSRADIIMAALPVLLCASGLLLTFTAGLWNIGVEGQITMGALAATIIARSITKTDTSPLIIPAELLLAMLGGALWATLTALLKTFGNVNEIFGGVALNFIAQNILISLINGPWRGGGRTAETAPFEAPALLPRLAGVRLSPLAIGIAVIAFLIIYFVLQGTRWGLQLKAMGRSQRSAFLLGVRTNRNIVLSMMACGALAGLAGAFQALFTQGRLIQGISSGLGFLSVLVVLLVNVQATWVPVVALFFAFVPVGTLQLASALDDAIRLDSSLGNAFQSGLVLIVLLVSGVRARLKQTNSE